MCFRNRIGTANEYSEAFFIVLVEKTRVIHSSLRNLHSVGDFYVQQESEAVHLLMERKCSLE